MAAGCCAGTYACRDAVARFSSDVPAVDLLRATAAPRRRGGTAAEGDASGRRPARQ